MQVTTFGLDPANRVFQIHEIDTAGRVEIRRRFQRSEIAVFFAGLPACLVGIEARATHLIGPVHRRSAYQVRLIPLRQTLWFVAARPMQQMPRPSARRSGDRACVSYR